MIRQTKGEKIFNIINTIILCALVVIMVYPCLHVLFASLSDSSELMKSGGFLIYPKGFTLNAYLEVFKNQLIWSGYGNTILNLVLALQHQPDHAGCLCAFPQRTDDTPPHHADDYLHDVL